MNITKKHRRALPSVLEIVIAVLLGASTAIQAESHTYYVATNGNDNAMGTIHSPWLTLRKAAKTMTAGDTTYARGGTYCEFVRFSASGTSKQPIQMLAFPNEVPIIDGARLGGV